ncbi:sce7726 family protein [Chryseobacterium hagamense]|uniref:Sce7726 family protein n=1 Tax=Chryseobacterium hagamense TaxID=395935 RepID=A0A511YNY8_9FLAO|nr:sce7726 family protein [Chryseobacterium hagamense]GEN76913.1 hypothetical protein CHA01nite_26530 [Chryseobacterium hagamense]
MKIKSKLNKSDYIQISKLFSTASFNSFASQDEEKINTIVNTFKEYCIDYHEFTLAQAYVTFYKLLAKKYKNEYVYKNIVLKDIILKNHHIKDCITIPEFNVNKSKADLAVFNGTSTVYEIKSEIDSTDRLKSQMSDYESFFEFLNVVISQRHLSKVKRIVPFAVGIYVLDDKCKIILEREATSNLSNITHKSLFYALRKPEYLYIIERKFGYIPKIPNTQIFAYCYGLFCSIEIEEAHNLVIEALRLRQFKDEQINLISLLPESLKPISFTKRYNKSNCDNIINSLKILHN